VRLRARLLRKTSTETRLRAAEAKYRTLVEQLPLVTYIDALTASATSLYASPQVEPLLGYSVEEWLADPEFFPKLLHPQDRDRILDLVDHCNETAELFRAEYRLIARDGRTVWVQDESLVVADEDGQPLFTQGYLLDITARKESEERLAAEHAVARAVAESTTLDHAASEIVRIVCDAFGWETGAIWLLDRGQNELTCASTRGTRGTSLAKLSWARREPIWAEHVERSEPVGAYAVPVVLGSTVLGVLEFGSPGLREPDEDVTGTIGVIASQLAQFIERKRSEEALRHQALHDALTGLPNRTLFHDRVRQALEQARRTGQFLALLVMDLDCFKDVNDTLGHQCGDELLQQVGSRLHESVRPSDTVSRLGGDEFGFLLTDVDASKTAALVERIQRALATPFTVQQVRLPVEASIGVALHPEHGEGVDQLLQRADVAMYAAKRMGMGCAFYEVEVAHQGSPRS
jgi:diguanylate cyclase (GGDEF)-like protein/PAS domain S-box-containing protein